MQRYSAKVFLKANTLLIRHIDSLRREDSEKPIPLDDVIRALEIIDQQCDLLGLAVSKNIVVDTINGFRSMNNTLYPPIVKEELETIVTAIASEVESFVFLKVNAEYAKLYSDLQPFGAIVAEKFPLATPDIEQGAKALACGLGTSSVFHMMRVMEVGLKALAIKLGIPYAPSWESYIRQIENRITAKHKTKGVRWKRDEPLFREILGDLQAVKIVWRNPTMHIVRHYSQEEGDDIFRAVRRFMRRLAEHLT